MKQYQVKKADFIRQQRGVTLIELLVSVFVFAIGVLGFSALQTRSLQATYDNAQREDVVWIADSLVARIRLNNTSALNYVTAVSGFGATCPANPPAPTCAEQQDGSGTGVCTGAELAAYDVWDVLCNNVDSNDTIRNSGGLGVVNGLQITLACQPVACPADANLDLGFTWCSKSVEAETNGANCNQPLFQQTYSLEFRP